MTKNILIVNQNTDEANSIQSRLASSATTVVCAHSLAEALTAFSKMSFCLVILDASLSEADDHKILKAMREAKTTPILLLSSSSDHSGRFAALQAGAQAYMGKPYTDEECLAQAHSLIQFYMDTNPQSELCYTLAFGNNLVIDPEKRHVTLQGHELRLTKTEFDLLFWLASNPGKVFNYTQLYDRVWEEYAMGDVKEIVKYHIKSLRKKLTTSEEEYIKNVWGVGYCFASTNELSA